MVKRCEWSGDANGHAMRMVMRRGIAAIVYLQLAERACFSWTISPGEGQPASCGVSTHEEWSGRLSGYTIITVLKLAVDGAGESGSFEPSHFWRKFAISTYNTHGNQLVF